MCLGSSVRGWLVSRRYRVDVSKLMYGSDDSVRGNGRDTGVRSAA
jgi:hypothetical protein